ncbi:MAG: InlB B-repeat-containing protein, partial [Erysipelotrichaceae bacterium]|nr:InlB B-repeat-containing protein [Erysipelotrichaceae bacterium]
MKKLLTVLLTVLISFTTLTVNVVAEDPITSEEEIKEEIDIPEEEIKEETDVPGEQEVSPEEEIIEEEIPEEAIEEIANEEVLLSEENGQEKLLLSDSLIKFERISSDQLTVGEEYLIVNIQGANENKKAYVMTHDGNTTLSALDSIATILEDDNSVVGVSSLDNIKLLVYRKISTAAEYDFCRDKSTDNNYHLYESSGSVSFYTWSGQSNSIESDGCLKINGKYVYYDSGWKCNSDKAKILGETYVYKLYKEKISFTLNSLDGYLDVTNPVSLETGTDLNKIIPTKEGFKFVGWYTLNGTETGEWGDKVDAVTSDLSGKELFAKYEIQTLTIYKRVSASDYNSTALKDKELIIVSFVGTSPNFKAYEMDATKSSSTYALSSSEVEIQSDGITIGLDDKTNEKVVKYTLDSNTYLNVIGDTSYGLSGSSSTISISTTKKKTKLDSTNNYLQINISGDKSVYYDNVNSKWKYSGTSNYAYIYKKYETTKVTFDPKEGSLDEPLTRTLEVGSSLSGIVPTPNDSSKIFDGWYTQDGTGDVWGDKIETVDKTHTTLYAKYVSGTIYKRVANLDKVASDDELLVVNFKDSSNAYKMDVSGATLSSSKVNVLSEDGKLIGVKDSPAPSKFKLSGTSDHYLQIYTNSNTYYLNGYNATLSLSTSTNNGKVYLASETDQNPSRLRIYSTSNYVYYDYTNNQWKRGSSPSNNSYLYKKYETTKVTFDPKEGSLDEPLTRTLEVGSSLSGIVPTPNDSSKIFDGWYTQDGTGDVWGDKIETVDKTHTTLYAKYVSGTIYKRVANLDKVASDDELLVVNFKDSSNAYKMDVSGATLSSSKVNVLSEDGKLIGVKDSPAPSKFKLSGTSDHYLQIYTNSNTYYLNGYNATLSLSTSTNNGKVYLASETDQNPSRLRIYSTSNYVYYDYTNNQWKRGSSPSNNSYLYRTLKNVTITFNATEGTLSNPPETLKEDSSLESIVPTSDNPKLSFVGWFEKDGSTTKDWGKQYTTALEELDGETIYAKWEEKTTYYLVKKTDVSKLTNEYIMVNIQKTLSESNEDKYLAGVAYYNPNAAMLYIYGENIQLEEGSIDNPPETLNIPQSINSESDTKHNKFKVDTTNLNLYDEKNNYTLKSHTNGDSYGTLLMDTNNKKTEIYKSSDDYSLMMKVLENKYPVYRVGLTYFESGLEGSDVYGKTFLYSANPTYLKVTFNANGGTVDGEESVELDEYYGEKFELPSEPNYSGYNFVGWFDTAATTGGTEYTTDTDVTNESATTLYARWEEESEEKTELKKPAITGTYTYNGSEQTVSLNNDYDEDYMHVDVTTNKATNAGTYTVKINIDDTDRYVWEGGSTDPLELEWTINQAQATVTADNKTKTYGADDPTLTMTCTDVLAADEAAVKALFEITRATGENVGEYAISLSYVEGYESQQAYKNYDLTTVAGKLTIGKKSATVTADNKTKTYGADDPT